MKIDSETFVCMICLAAFIGYTLGIQNMVKNTIKTTQQCHKVTQTNLSDLADILTSSHLMINNSQKNSIMQTQTQSPTPVLDNICNTCDSLMLTTTNVHVQDVVSSTVEEDKIDSVETCASLEIHNNNNKMTANNVIASNNSEEEYEVITGSIKKLYKKNQPRYYFGWFDSIF